MRVISILAGSLIVLFASIPFAQSWEVHSEIDPFTDMGRAGAFKINSSGEQSRLVIRCIDNELEIFVEFMKKIDHTQAVTSRVGKQDPITEFWIGSTTQMGVFHVHPSFLLKQLWDDESKFAIRVVTQEGLRVQSIFDLSGMKKATEPLGEAGCSRHFPKSTQ